MLKDIIYYILQKQGKMPLSRIILLVYLIDWKYCLEYGKQITNASWYFGNYGPFTDIVEKTILSNKNIFLISSNKEVKKKGFLYKVDIEQPIIKTIQFILKETKHLSMNEFYKFVLSTFPIYSSIRFSHLDLTKIAFEYKKE